MFILIAYYPKLIYYLFGLVDLLGGPLFLKLPLPPFGFTFGFSWRSDDTSSAESASSADSSVSDCD